MNPSSDEYVFGQLFVHREYAPICMHLKDPKVIFDLGANVGYASAFFASRYPNARILAVEPDPLNFEVCDQNLIPYGNRIRTLRGAVWSHRSRLALSYRYGDGWATKVMPVERESDAEVDAWDMTALMDLFQAEVVDLLKIDIEGSEAQLFAANTASWLRRARNICIELHDQECREVFFKAISEFDCELHKWGEFTMCLNLQARKQATNQPSNSSVISARSFR